MDDDEHHTDEHLAGDVGSSVTPHLYDLLNRPEESRHGPERVSAKFDLGFAAEPAIAVFGEADPG